MSYREFLHSTPNYIRLKLEAHDEMVRDQTRIMKMQSWMTGMYVMAAIGSTFGKSKYPENPLEKEAREIGTIARNTGLSEEELSQKLMMANLMVQQANAKLASVGKEAK